MLALSRSGSPLDIALADQLRIDKSAVTRMPNQLSTAWLSSGSLRASIMVGCKLAKC